MFACTDCGADRSRIPPIDPCPACGHRLEPPAAAARPPGRGGPPSRARDEESPFAADPDERDSSSRGPARRHGFAPTPRYDGDVLTRTVAEGRSGRRPAGAAGTPPSSADLTTPAATSPPPWPPSATASGSQSYSLDSLEAPDTIPGTAEPAVASVAGAGSSQLHPTLEALDTIPGTADGASPSRALAAPPLGPAAADASAVEAAWQRAHHPSAKRWAAERAGGRRGPRPADVIGGLLLVGWSLFLLLVFLPGHRPPTAVDRELFAQRVATDEIGWRFGESLYAAAQMNAALFALLGVLVIVRGTVRRVPPAGQVERKWALWALGAGVSLGLVAMALLVLTASSQ